MDASGGLETAPPTSSGTRRRGTTKPRGRPDGPLPGSAAGGGAARRDRGEHLGEIRDGLRHVQNLRILWRHVPIVPSAGRGGARRRPSSPGSSWAAPISAILSAE